VTDRLTWSENGRIYTDCPICAHAARVDRHRDRLHIRCYGGCSEDALGRTVDIPALLMELTDMRVPPHLAKRRSRPRQHELQANARHTAASISSNGSKLPPTMSIDVTSPFSSRRMICRPIRRKMGAHAAAAEHGVPREVIDLLTYLFSEVLDGRNAHVADGIQRALGREPRDFREYARDAAATGSGPRAPRRRVRTCAPTDRVARLG
jgi:hypothetical protein